MAIKRETYAKAEAAFPGRVDVEVGYYVVIKKALGGSRDHGPLLMRDIKKRLETLPQHKEIFCKVNSLLHSNEDVLLPADLLLRIVIVAAQLERKSPALSLERVGV
eukprot:scaffold39034_cov450-Skeletonema_dohrnii-CCMP3373.AAC.1